jgi:hypothetical protein
MKNKDGKFNFAKDLEFIEFTLETEFVLPKSKDGGKKAKKSKYSYSNIYEGGYSGLCLFDIFYFFFIQLGGVMEG